MFKLTVLGSGSAIPSIHRGPSSHVLTVNGKLYLIDCGEGTQLRLRKARIKMQSIDKVFISHLHGDHYYGLIGLISTMHLLGRAKDIDIYGPAELEGILRLQLQVARTDLKFKMNFHAIKERANHVICEDKHVIINAFPLKHRIPTWGFRFQEKEKKPNIDKAFVAKYQPEIDEIAAIKRGEDYVSSSGELIPNEEITRSAEEARSYSYCSDTKYDQAIIPYIYGTTLLYHEASFGNDLKHEAANRFHATAEEAARIAKEANVKQLLIGHFSARYKEVDVLINEAKTVFPNTVGAEDNFSIEL